MSKFVIGLVFGMGLSAGGCARQSETAMTGLSDGTYIFRSGAWVNEQDSDVYFSGTSESGSSASTSEPSDPVYVYRGGRDPSTGRARTTL